MKVSVSALGDIKKFIPNTTDIELTTSIPLKEFKVAAGVPKEKTVSFVVNGRVQKPDYMTTDGDQIKILMVVGAG